MKVLIVEDDLSLSNVLKEKLEKNDIETEVLSNGDKVLSTIKSKGFDLVILDVLLPRTTGLAVLKEIVQDEQTKLIPVIMLTNLDDPKIEKKALELGAREYLAKTKLTLGAVVEKVTRLLSAPKY